ncbi:hypothetical protein RUND412_005899 [Rhizina undulata]
MHPPTTKRSSQAFRTCPQGLSNAVSTEWDLQSTVLNLLGPDKRAAKEIDFDVKAAFHMQVNDYREEVRYLQDKVDCLESDNRRLWQENTKLEEEIGKLEVDARIQKLGKRAHREFKSEFLPESDIEF